MAESLEVHGQKGNIGDDIAVAQLVAELDAVEDSHPVIETEDVLGLKIPVSVTYASRSNPLAEQWPVTFSPAKRQRSDLCLNRSVENRSHEVLSLRKIGLPSSLQHGTGCRRRDVRRARCLAVELDQSPGHPTKPFVGVSPLADQVGQSAAFRHAAHDDHVVDGFAVELDVGNA